MTCARQCPVDSGAHACGYPDAPAVDLVQPGTDATLAACTWCSLWRSECAAREVHARAMLRMVDRAARLDALARHEAENGALARQRLADAVMAIWQRRQFQPSTT